MQYLEFEKEVEPLENEIEQLRLSDGYSSTTQEVVEQINAKRKEADKLLNALYRKLDSWQTCQVARHPQRPQALDYIELLFSDFSELHGDRMYADDRAIIGGLARFGGDPVMVIGHQKGRETEDRLTHNFGMPHPEGYRKALRLIKLAEKFKIPLVTLIDTPGAYCGIGSEERGISQAIGANLLALSRVRVPVVCAVIGEGGSGGALAIGVGDELLMLEHAVYSVITPEGCAAILWKEGEGNQEKAANAMRMRARDLEKLGLIDTIVPEPVGGAHRDRAQAAANLGKELRAALTRLRKLQIGTCLKRRESKLRDFGKYADKGS